MKKKIYIGAGIIFILDLISKIVISNTLTLGKEYYIIPKFFYLYLSKNTGAAWSILSNSSYILAIISVVALIFLHKEIKEDMNKLYMVAFILIIGGILGNLFDRVFYGYVIDFIGFNIFGYYFPIFNVADICITLGAILIIICLIKGDRNEVRSSK